MNRSISYVPVKQLLGNAQTREEIAVINTMLHQPTENPIPPKLMAELNKTYRRNVRKAKLRSFFGKAGKFGLWYVGINVVLYIAVGIALLSGVDIIALLTEAAGL